MRKLIAMGCLSYLVIGMAHVVGGAILEPMMASYGLEYRDGGQFIMNQFLGFLGGVLLSPTVSRLVGRRNSLLLAFGVLTLVSLAYSLMLPWGWMLAIAPLAGVGFGMTEALIGAIIIEYVEERKASAMARLEVFFGLGALVMPLAAAFLIRAGWWELSFPVVAALAGLATVLWGVLSFGKADVHLARRPQGAAQAVDAQTAEESEGAPAGAIGQADGQAAVQKGVAATAGAAAPAAPAAPAAATVAKPRYRRAALPFLMIGIAYLLVYVGMEMSFSNYLPSLMIQRTGMDEGVAPSTMSLFWGMMVVGRLFAGRLADWAGYARYLLVSTALGLVAFLLLSLTSHVGWSLFFVGLNGLIWSGVFAVSLVYINQLLPGMTERTTSLLVAFGGLGGAIFPKLTGWMMDHYDAGATLLMLTGLALGLLLFLIALVLLGRGRSRGLAHAIGDAR